MSAPTTPRHKVLLAGEELEALVDTGFEGAVAVPEGFLAAHGIDSYATSYVPAHGESLDTWGGVALVEWLGETWDECEIIEVGGEDALVGMVLLDGTRLDIQSPDVKIRRLSPPKKKGP